MTFNHRGARLHFTLLTALGAVVAPLPSFRSVRALPLLQAASAPASLSGFSDAGTFDRYLNNQKIGAISFRWFEDGRIENSTSISRGSQIITATTKIACDNDGRWVKIEILTPGSATTVVREGAIAKFSTGASVSLEPNSALFGPYAPVLMSQAVRLYDRTKGGRQPVSLFLFSGARTAEATLEFLDKVTRSVGEERKEFMRYAYRLPRLAFVLWTDENGRLYYAENPDEHGAFVRAGYEALLPALRPPH